MVGRKGIVRYVRPLIFAALIFLFCVYWEKLFSQSGAKEIIGTLSDCFLIPGVMLAGAGGISWAAKFGTLDMLSFGFKSFFGHFIKSLSADMPRTFYDYKTERAEKRKKWHSETLITGLVFIAVSVLLLVVYSVI
ncbi:MAG: DUF3899 domain-containing protein [Firmicutes bacterium]|nr:DUF3899 domain-containing protein [Bacillota bacterium]